jgi:hypothetical protein
MKACGLLEGAMSQPDNFEPPGPGDRPLCANCGWTMWIARIEPHIPGHDKHTFKCTRCEFEDEVIVRL